MAKVFNLIDSMFGKKKAAKKKSTSKKTIDAKSLSILKITVSDWTGRTKGNPYRIISIPTSDSLDGLAYATLESFEFDCDHLYGFYDNLKKWTKSTEMYSMDDDFEDSTGSTSETLIGEVFAEPKKKMLFLFDYGDEWRFIIELLRIETPEGKTKLATKVIESKGEAPEQYPDFEA